MRTFIRAERLARECSNSEGLDARKPPAGGLEGNWNDSGKNSKGCDFGYALAAASCEGANSVDARTVTALDVTTAFAVPDPGGFLAKPSVFSGPEALPVARLG